jgi:hypothetical protein
MVIYFWFSLPSRHKSEAVSPATETVHSLPAPHLKCRRERERESNLVGWSLPHRRSDPASPSRPGLPPTSPLPSRVTVEASVPPTTHFPLSSPAAPRCVWSVDRSSMSVKGGACGTPPPMRALAVAVQAIGLSPPATHVAAGI